jgi:hypothetical protein
VVVIVHVTCNQCVESRGSSGWERETRAAPGGGGRRRLYMYLCLYKFSAQVFHLGVFSGRLRVEGQVEGHDGERNSA